MNRAPRAALLFFALFSSTALGQSDHELHLYDYPGASGSWVLINNYVEDLSTQGFNDLASSLCVMRGIWLVYQSAYYNTYNYPGTSAFFWGENVCHDLLPSLNNQVSSVRYAGSAWSYKDDAVNIYQADWFQANEVFVAGDSYNLPAYYGGSLIVTGFSTWTLYDSPNFAGYRVCVTSSDLTYGYPGFFPNPADFGFNGRVVRSVRKGCWTADGEEGLIFKARDFPSGKLHLKPAEQ